MPSIRCLLPLVVALSYTHFAQAHFPILIHDAALSATNGPVTVTYAIGHPFELEFEPSARPERVQWLDRRGRVTNVTGALKETLFRADTNAVAWQFVFDPPVDDLLVALDSEAVTDSRLKSIYREYVKLWLYRGRQDGWQQRTGQPIEIVPLTRPVWSAAWHGLHRTPHARRSTRAQHGALCGTSQRSGAVPGVTPTRTARDFRGAYR
jgi:hypothetical protein